MLEYVWVPTCRLARTGAGLLERVAPERYQQLVEKVNDYQEYYQGQWEKADELSTEIADRIHVRLRGLTVDYQVQKDKISRVIEPAKNSIQKIKDFSNGYVSATRTELRRMRDMSNTCMDYTVQSFQILKKLPQAGSLQESL